jgi:tetratricopeptide (TPR) repeat protein
MHHTLPTGSALAALFAALPGSRRFKPAQIEAVHRMGFAALAAGELQQAQRFYEWLTIYAGQDARAWRGMAACLHAQGEFAAALLHWTMVSLLDPQAIDATLYAGRCQAQLGQVDEARATLDLVRRHPGAEPALRQQAEQLVALLSARPAARPGPT